MTNTPDFEVQDKKSIQRVSDYSANGGQVLFAGFLPMKFWMNNSSFSIKIPGTEFFHTLFNVDSVIRQPMSMMFRANAVAPGYDTLHVDELKSTTVWYPGQLNNIEIFAPSPDARVIYCFYSKYNSNTTLGKMKNRPVGIEYIGPDFKSVLLSFPLYYMDTGDVMNFLHYVMTEKFNHALGIRPDLQADPHHLIIYPNPANDLCTVTFNLPEAGKVRISLLSVQGQLLTTMADRVFEKGAHSMSFTIGSNSAGLYLLVLQSEGRISVRKIIKL